jgi:phosphatidylglycerol---prolipoprotein diacylglyceryl transferase
MHPTLFSIGPLTVKTYGLMVALGMFAALQYVLFRAKRAKIPEENMLDLVLYMIVAGLVGGRLAYVLLNFGYYMQTPSEIIKVWEGGMIFYGGLALGALAGYAYIKKHKALSLPKIADISAPAIALGHAFGRLGCFFAGCCYGSVCDLPWAVRFSDPRSLAPTGIGLHPTQLYEALGNLLIFVFLDWYNRFEHKPGKAFWVYIFFYGMLRFHIEFLRGDDRGGFVLGMSPGQLISFAAVLVSIFFITRLKENK